MPLTRLLLTAFGLLCFFAIAGALPASTNPSPTPTAQSLRPGVSAWLRIEAPNDTLSLQWYLGEPGDTTHPVAGATATLLVTPPIRSETRYWCRITTPDSSVDSTAATVTPMQAEAGYVMAGAGVNTGMRLGLPSWQSRTFRLHPIATHVIAATATYQATHYLKTDGTLHSVGDVTSAGAYIPSTPPRQIAEGVTDFSSDGSHVAIIRQDGSLWLKNRDSATAKELPFLSIAPLALSATIRNSRLYYITPDATLMAVGLEAASQPTNQTNPFEIARGVASADFAAEHRLILKTDGTLWAEGQNYYGALGAFNSLLLIPTQIAEDVVRISTSYSHSLFVRSDGSLWVMGDSGAGMASAVPNLRFRSPRQISTNPVREIVATGNNSLWIDKNNTLWGAGSNLSGSLGDGSIQPRPNPTRIAEGAVSLSDVEDCTLYLGQSHRVAFDPGLHGRPLEHAALVQHVLHGHAANAPEIEVDPGYALADWGAPYSEVTGPLNLTARYVTLTLPVFSQPPEPQAARPLTNAVLHSRAAHNAPLTPIRYQWYRGASGDITAPVAGAVSPVLLTPPLVHSQSFWVRATNAAGHTDSASAEITVTQLDPTHPLGRGRIAPDTLRFLSRTSLPGTVATPSIINGRWLRIDTDLRLWTTTLSPIDPPTLVAEDVLAAAMGDDHTLFLKSDGSLWGYGKNSNGQLGDGTNFTRTTPVKIADGVAAIAASDNHSLMIKTDGSLWAFGNAQTRSLGVPQSGPLFRPTRVADNVVTVSTGVGMTAFIQNNRQAWCMGFIPLDLGTLETSAFMPQPLAQNVTSVSVGYRNLVYVTLDHLLWALGDRRPDVANSSYSDPSHMPRLIATDTVDAKISDEGSVVYRNTSGQLRRVSYSSFLPVITLVHDVVDYGFEANNIWILSPTRQVVQRFDPRAVTGASERTALAFLGAAPPTPVATARTGWRFVGWHDAPERILEDIALTARYLSPFAQWAASQNLTDDSPYSTSFNDAVPNLLAYALGRPTSAAYANNAWATLTPRLSTHANEPRFSFTHRRRKSALAQIIYEQSHDLSDSAGWMPVDLTPTVLSADADGDGLTELVEVTLPMSTSYDRPVFLRLRVVE